MIGSRTPQGLGTEHRKQFYRKCGSPIFGSEKDSEAEREERERLWGALKNYLMSHIRVKRVGAEVDLVARSKARRKEAKEAAEAKEDAGREERSSSTFEEEEAAEEDNDVEGFDNPLASNYQTPRDLPAEKTQSQRALHSFRGLPNHLRQTSESLQA